MDYANIIIEPIVTEKSTLLIDTQNQYVFKVAKKANKNMIKKAIESMFAVTVEDVRTTIMPRKQRGTGRRKGFTGVWKKAIVSLKDGDKIELVKGV